MRILDRHVLSETAIASGVATGAFVFVMAAGNVLSQVASAIAAGRVTPCLLYTSPSPRD